jgi:6-hydroxynicotinate reductase
MVTVVTEGIFSYCGVKVKIDTDRHLGPECAPVRVEGRAGRPRHHRRIRLADAVARRRAPPDRRLEEGGPRHLRHAAGAVQPQAVELTIDGGARVVVEAGKAPDRQRHAETRMRVGCGSATIGIFAQQWLGHVDEVVVVDDHITGVLSEHQAGKVLGMRPTGIRDRGRRSTPGRYFQVANRAPAGAAPTSPTRWIIEPFDPKVAWPGLRLLMVSTTGEHALYCVLDEALTPGAGRCRRPCARWWTASARIASPRSARCCSWPAPAARCAPASPRTRCC